MTLLSPSNLETLDYNQSGWNFIHDKNIELLATLLLQVRYLQDVDITNLVNGSVLVWDAAQSKHVAKVWA